VTLVRWGSRSPFKCVDCRCDGRHVLARYSSLLVPLGLQKSAITLSFLNVEGNDLTDSGMAKICRAMQYCQYLECAILRENRLGEKAAVELAVAIGGSSLRNGREVPLLPNEDANRKANGGVWTPPIVNPHRNLRSLDMAWNSTGVHGSAHIFNAIALNHSLQTLDVSWNGIGGSRSKTNPSATSAGIAALCDMVQANTTLTHLDLSHNSINFSNAKLFATAMRENHSIRCVLRRGVLYYILLFILVWGFACFLL
jgi:Leucine Rich repeat